MALARQYLRLAALLHDIGHASFSHAAEQVAHGDVGHEALSIRIVRERDLLGGVLASRFPTDCTIRVAQIIEGGPDLPPQLQVLHTLVSGEMDADRTDYLLRDSLHCGVDYGRFDHRRMIECLALQEESNGALEIALTRDGIHTFEALILARYQMNTQVYYHRLRRIYDCYLTNYHKALGSEAPNTPEKVLAHNDVTMMAKIMEDAECGDEERQQWARRIRDRCHHRLIHETGANANAMELRWSQEVLQVLQKDYPECSFIWDRASASIHKLLVPEDQDDAGRVPLMLIGRDGSRRLLGEESQVLRYIPRRFQCARIFGDVTGDRDELRREIEERAVREWQNRGGH